MNDKSLDRIEIMKLLPHRDPFLHIDRIVDYELGESIICLLYTSDAADE